jgi:hypothetical protein
MLSPQQRDQLCGICGAQHIDYSKRCHICGGAHDGDWHARVGGMGVWWHLGHSVRGLPREVLDDPLLRDAHD